MVSGGSLVKTIGIWLGFSFKVPMRREGIGRYLASLSKSLVENFDVDIEGWSYEFQRKEAENLFEKGLPWQIMEALLMGTPAIMARIPVTVERLEKEGIDLNDPGLMFFDPHDANQLVEKIIEAVSDREGVALKQQAIREKLLRRTWEDVGREYFEIFVNLAEEQNASSTSLWKRPPAAELHSARGL
jgi:glycosyltransferase involved in cell wall biosynthesis